MTEMEVILAPLKSASPQKRRKKELELALDFAV